MEEGHPQKFWCYICKKQFTAVPKEDAEVECVYCKNTFSEMLEENQPPPQDYEPYLNPPQPNQAPEPNPTQPPQSTQPMNYPSMPITYSFYSSSGNGGTFGGAMGSYLQNLMGSFMRPMFMGNIPGTSNMNFDQLLQYLAERDPK